MTFGLKNASATYQSAMNYMLQELISKIVEIYSDDVVSYFSDSRMASTFSLHIV
jgi:hypothetical protein